MKGIFTGVIKYCPECGDTMSMDNLSQSDYFNGASQSCNTCDFSWQYIDESIIMEKLADYLDTYF